MPPGTAPIPELQLDQFIRAYETAQDRDGQADLAQFLPPADHPLFRDVLCELIRVDLEFRWERGCPRDLRDYQRLFPDVLGDPASLQEIAFEEYRLRCQAGQPAAPEEYEFRFGVTVASWPRPMQANGVPAAPPPNGHVAGWPTAGTRFLDFTLLHEIGRGTFARVFLARQPTLADRLVALKISPRQTEEPQALAQLQHTHIVPIYSIHRDGPWQAVCMPYFGATTLADVLKHLEGRPTMPQSGRELIDTLEARRSVTRVASENPTSREGPLTEAAPSVAVAPCQLVTLTPDPTHLARLTYVETVLWLAVRLADGLAHAHERGILHRDLKPANILLTDDGQPMLLDFNLSEDIKVATPASEARVGGTLPYMAPEHLEAFAGTHLPVDARSDVYALGVILFELLTGKPPFPARRGPLKMQMVERLADRRQPPPRLRELNPAVSPAAESIVRHCLEPEPARRYQSAQQLREDVQRHLDHHPLAHAPEPSPRERWGKWRHRHPRLTSSVTVSLAALALLLGMVGYFLHYLSVQAAEHLSQVSTLAAEQLRQDRLNALAGVQHLREEMRTIRYLLRGANVEAAQRAEGSARSRQVFEQYRVLEGPGWQEGPAVLALEPADRQWLREQIGELLLHEARIQLRQADQTEEPGQRESLAEAQRLNQLAEACYAPNSPPPVLWRQRAELWRWAGAEAQAREFDEQALNTPWTTPRDNHLLIWDKMDRGRIREVIPLLWEHARGAPNNPLFWTQLGDCQIHLGRPAEAVHYYTLAILQEPERSTAYFNRGSAQLELKKPREALADFDSAVRLGHDAVAYFMRALAKMGLQDFRGAEADLTKALEADRPPVRALFARARVREQLGNLAGAQQDRAEGIRREPRDEADWTARAVNRLPRNPKEALADLDKALQINPRYRSALQSKAHVLAEYLQRPADAVSVLDRVIELYPDFPPARAGRGVVLARLGQREAAHQDAAELLKHAPRAEDVYRVACIHALTSRQQPEDRREALRHLAAALRQGFGGELLARDRDLDPLRDDPEFQRLVQAAGTLQGKNEGKAGP